MIEEWKDVSGWEGLYKVSDLGRVQGPRTILKPHPNKDGYFQVLLFRKGRGTNKLVSRLVCEAFHGPPPFEGAQALHRDGINIHNYPDNLYWGTHQQNMDDQQRLNELPVGEDHHRAKLTWSIVVSIRERATSGESAYKIGKDIGISNRHCLLIIRNQMWPKERMLCQ